MLTFKEYIFLIEATGEQLYKQVYGKKIPWETFYKIVSGDIERVEDKNIAKDLGYDKVQDYLWKNIPQTQFNGEDITNVGTKAKWVLGLWLNDEFEASEDTLRDIYNAYTTYNVTKSKKLKNTPFENFRKVESIKSVSDLMKIDRYIKNNINSTKKTTITDSANDIDVIFENEEWKVLIPLTYRSSKLYGFQKCKATWCTASSDSIFYYNKYMVTNNLYIFFNKEDPKGSFQMGFEEIGRPEFKDTNNDDYNINTFRKENEELEPTIQEILDEWKKIDEDGEYKQKKMFERFYKTKSPNILYEIISQNEDVETMVKMLKYLPKNVLRQKILINELFVEGSMLKMWSTFLQISMLRHNETLINFLNKYADIKIERDDINNIPIYNTLWNNKKMELGIKQDQIKKEMVSALKYYKINNYKILENLQINVLGDVDLSANNITNIPFTFNEVIGNVIYTNNKLTSLEGAPQKVGGDFNCSSNTLKSLEGTPQKVGGEFDCSFNKLESLEGIPQKVGGDFDCSFNKLTSLKGCPQKVGGDFDCSFNKLESLEGTPREIGGDFDCSENILSSLEGCPQKVGGDFSCSFNKLESLKSGPQKVDGGFYCTDNKLTSLKYSPQEIGGNFNCDDNKLESLEGAPQKVDWDFSCSSNELESLEGAPQKVGGDFNCYVNKLTSLEGAPQEVGGDFDCDDNDDLTEEEINRYRKSIGKG